MSETTVAVTITALWKHNQAHDRFLVTYRDILPIGEYQKIGSLYQKMIEKLRGEDVEDVKAKYVADIEKFAAIFHPPGVPVKATIETVMVILKLAALERMGFITEDSEYNRVIGFPF